MNELDILQWIEDNHYKAFVVEYKLDGVRTINLWGRDNGECKTIEYDPRWDCNKTKAGGRKT